MAHRASKRPKIEKSACTRGEDDYLPGNIVEIEIHNFMTYDHLKCKPGSRLNLVIGPNGSGKSSIVCAIALGLGGDPQILGRAGSIGAFVKRGEDSGFIRISLRGDSEEEKIVITRKIDINNKSEWEFNGVSVPKRDILGIIERFNIQVNNLTQFLPQDRVCEFAKLSPIQLLEETEKAVGDAELPIQHQTLIETSKQVKKLDMTIKQNQETLKYLKDQHAEQEKDVERVRQREKLLKKVDLMKKKMPWLKYDMKRMEYEEAKKKEAEAKKKLDQVARSLNELKGPVEEHKKAKQTHETAMKKLSTLITQNANKRSEVIDMENKLVVQVHGKYAEMDQLKKQEESRQHRIENAKKELDAAETELANLPVYDPPTVEIEKLSTDILDIRMNQNQLKSKRKERENLLSQTKLSLKKCLDRLDEMKNYKYKLLQALRNNGADKIVEAYKWLQEHRNDMQKEVFGPVLLDVTVANPTHASYLESQVPNYIWKSFIAQDPADRDYLVKNLKSFDVPVLNFVENKANRITPFQISHGMHELGIESRLDQVFEAPEAVKKVLISQAGLDNSYIGSRQADQRAGEVPNLGIMDLWTPESHYKWSVSRYGGHMSTMVDPVHNSRLFACSIDVGDIESLKATRIRLEQTISELEGNIKELQAQERDLVEAEADLQKQREQLVEAAKAEKKKRRDIENFVGQKRRKVESISKEGGIELSTKKLCDEVARLSDTRHQNAIKIKTLLTEAVALKWSFSSKQMMAIELDAKIREMEIGLKQHEKSALAVASLLDTCKTETRVLKEQLDNLKRNAESFATITNQLAREFEKMPGTIEELEAAIQDTISEANSILFLNQNILQEYESRKDKIADLVAKVEADQEELNKHRSEIQILKEKWLLRLQDLVVKINDTFSRNFQEMAVAGEVSLDEHGMDFDQYGILIKVKFRQTGLLQVLSAHHQSGGERSVSTILYLVSLQDLTICPFRVVDEINQGMDPVNERKMFQQLVRAASQPNTPQCFLLTPKLLPDLEYSDACSILNIMNGPWIDKPAKLWSSGQNWGHVMGLTKS